MEISNDLAQNIILDFKKRDISLEEKSKFIKAYIEEHKLSERELGRQLGISHSTVHDWVSMRQQNKTKNENLLSTNSIFTLANRLKFLLKKEDVSKLPEKTLKELSELRIIINEIM